MEQKTISPAHRLQARVPAAFTTAAHPSPQIGRAEIGQRTRLSEFGREEDFLRTAGATNDLRNQLHQMIRDDPTFAVRTHVPRGGAIYNSGDQDLRMYLVEVGQFKTTASSADGKQCLLSIHTRGDMFGELGLLGAPRHDTATAMKDSVIRRINSAKLFNMLINDDHLNWYFTRFLMAKLLDQQQTITQLVTMDSEHRLAATLLRLARKVGRQLNVGMQIDAKITQEELASMVGTTRSRVGLFLKHFRKAKLVDQLPGGYLLINEAALTEYVERGQRELGLWGTGTTRSATGAGRYLHGEHGLTA
ncbi:Crp/Fnr family transcriptional regulator [Micromonospora sp. NBC_01796]|uniref:Crp/Fnr family transcriptional regulator n=1 Tax=Micromonospora sp. NBC_01796 TaxID=2975987 RepID=UPI002DD99B7F|nr:Crp/Fnr family transcriptional regulator [Micromonospora sp. NBC_01796]WSA84086.1 Crp/Fnr family transcriptional regulator [Micromonospora sp. NBC_01796]